MVVFNKIIKKKRLFFKVVINFANILYELEILITKNANNIFIFLSQCGILLLYLLKS